MSLFIGYSEWYRRWQYVPWHLVVHDVPPYRGERNTAACGTWVNVSQSAYKPDPKGHAVCKRCLRAVAKLQVQP
jgi:hypothetical protein